VNGEKEKNENVKPIKRQQEKQNGGTGSLVSRLEKQTDERCCASGKKKNWGAEWSRPKCPKGAKKTN